MSSDSGGNSEMEIVEEESWTEPRERKKTKRKRTSELTQKEINNIIVGSTPSSSTKTAQINVQQKTAKNGHSQTKQNKNINYSPIMKGIHQKTYQHIFYITADQNYSRINFTDYWGKIYPNAKDIILQTQKGLLLKTDSLKESIINTLNKLVELGKIIRFNESTTNIKSTTTPQSSTSYSVIIASVELEIEDQTISEFLQKNKLDHRYCKRIISRATNRPTTLIRVITSLQSTSETLLSEGLFYKYKHYPVYPSKPPPPIPKPCNKCMSFEHTTETCNTPPKCPKCLGSHVINKCSSTLPPKCHSCGSEEHQAWSFKCPNRPTAPIQGIPNVKIKSLNKKSHEVSPENRKTRIHQPVTIHDDIINTYVNELNKPKNTNREELLAKLKKKFINNYKVDTTAVFTGSRVYILIFDMELQDHFSPTEPLHTSANIQYEHVTT